MLKTSPKLYLYLAVACFLGIVAIFVFAGYLGIYDTVYFYAGEYEQKIGPEFWNQSARSPYPYSTGAPWEQTVTFRYEINNRTFSGYSAPVEVILWKNNQQVLDVFLENIHLGSFDMTTLEWSLSPQDLGKAGLSIDQYTLKIKRGNTELGQGIVIGFYSNPGVVKPIPPPSPN